MLKNNSTQEKGLIRMVAHDMCKNPLGRVLLVPLFAALISGLTGAIGGFFGVKLEVDRLSTKLVAQSEKIQVLTEDFKTSRLAQDALHTELIRLSGDYKVFDYRLHQVEKKAGTGK